MAKMRVYYDEGMDTLDIWFDEPPDEGFSREIEDGIIVKYDKNERIVGIEILFLSKQEGLPDEIRKEMGRYLEKCRLIFFKILGFFL